MGLVQATPAELAEIAPLLMREEKWHQGAPRFNDTDDVMAAGLVPVIDDGNVRPIRRFTVDKQPVGSYALLTENALLGLAILGVMFRHELDSRGRNDPTLRLAVTSMTRTEIYQQHLVENTGTLASPTSTHPTGNTLDIDWSAYYLNRQGELHSVMDPRRYDREYIEAYDRRVTDAAYAAARLLHEAQVINLVPEYVGTANACLHMSVAPNLREVIARSSLHTYLDMLNQ